jgi:hypothetical protein
MKSYKDMINEVLTKSTPASEWIKDFVDSDNPKFAGKSAAKRKEMALAAYYAKKNESAAASQNSTAEVDMRESAGEHLVHVNDGSKYDEKPHEKDVEHIMAGIKTHGGEHAGASDKGAFFKFKSKDAADAFRSHVNKCPNKSCDADHVNEAVEYKGIGTDVVDKKKKLNPQPNFTTNKKQVKDFKEEVKKSTGDLKKACWKGYTAVGLKMKDGRKVPNCVPEEVQVQVEAKVYDPITKKMVPTKPIKVQAGGGATKNGVPVETGPSKYKQELKKEAYEHGPIDRDVKIGVGHKAAVLAGSGLDSGKHGTIVGSSKERTGDMWHIKTSSGDIVKMHKNRVAKLKEEAEQIDEVSKSTLMRYIPKASRDVGSHTYAGKEAGEWANHYTRAGDWSAAEKHSKKSYADFKKANKRIAGIDTATKKLGTQKEEVELDEAIAKKLPVQHAVDAVHATLGPKSATRFLSHLSPGTDKHTSWDKVNDALVKQGVQTHHIASIAQKTSHMNEEVVDESRGHKVLATFFKNREVAQRAFQGNPAKDAEVAQGGGTPADQGIAAAKKDAEELKKKVSESYTPSVEAPAPKKTKSTAKEYASATIPGTKRVTGSKSDNNEPGEQIKEDQYTAEYKIKYYVDPVTGENKTRKIRPHRVNFKASKMRGEPVQQDAQGDYGMKEGYVAEGGFDNYHEIAKELIKRHGKNVDTGHINDLAGERDTHRGLDHSEVMHHVNKILSKEVKEGDEYDEKWKQYKGKTFKKESRMINFKDYLKEAWQEGAGKAKLSEKELSAKQKKIAAIAGEKDKIDAHDLAALRAGKKPVDEASCSSKDMKKEELVGNQHKLDKNKNGKLDAHDFKLLRKEEVELDEGKMKDIHIDMMDHATKKGYSSHKQFTPADYETVGKQHGISGKELAIVAGHKTAQQADTHFKKPVQPGKGMDRAKALAQRGMQSLSKEEVERIEEKLTQIDELSKKTLGSYVNKAAKDSRIHGQIATDFENTADKARKQSKKDSFERLNRKYLEKSWKREDGIAKAVGKLTKEEVELDESAGDQLLQAARECKPGSKSYHTGMIKYHDHMADVHHGKREGKEHEEKMRHHQSELASLKEEVSAEMSPYLKGALAVMDEGKIDNLRDAQKLRQDTQSAYDKNYKPDTSHPHIQVVKGTAYGGENQKDDEGDEKPDETKEKKGRGRPTGSKSGARQKGGGHEDGGIPVHNLNLPKSYK